MFWKKQPTQPTQSQQFGNVTINGGQMQAAQAGGDVAQEMSGENAGQQQGMTGAEVVALLEKLKGAVAESGLTGEQKEELQDYLKVVKREAGKTEPDKDLMGANVKKLGETMKSLKDATEAGKSLWQTGGEILKTIGPWVGIAVSFFG
jgi:predicted metalloprotease with PDZ domain